MIDASIASIADGGVFFFKNDWRIIIWLSEKSWFKLDEST